VVSYKAKPLLYVLLSMLASRTRTGLQGMLKQGTTF
jgi:hypothetical protein